MKYLEFYIEDLSFLYAVYSLIENKIDVYGEIDLYELKQVILNYGYASSVTEKFINEHKKIKINSKRSVKMLTCFDRYILRIYLEEVSDTEFILQTTVLSNKDYFSYQKIILNEPATIVIWKDGTKTIVQCSKDEKYDPEKGIALCFMKRALGNKGNYNNVFRKGDKK